MVSGVLKIVLRAEGLAFLLISILAFYKLGGNW